LLLCCARAVLCCVQLAPGSPPDLTPAPPAPRPPPRPAQLACARLGAVFSVVFAGFSAESLAGRIADSSPKMVVTCSAVKRGPKHIELKKIVDEVRGGVVAACLPACAALRWDRRKGLGRRREN
jgi:hypothetical protein